ncbi:MAG TPA: EamA family transporter [Candidatus Scatomorpha merdavium]|nr:EamA family transporter [Candidatus Scatomorpha merdavium]
MSRNRAIFEMLLCAALWSIAGIFIKLIPWNSIVIAGIRSLIAGAVMFVYMRYKRIGFTADRRSMLGGLALCCTLTCFVAANKLTTAANSIVLQFTAPMFIVVFSVLFLKKKFSRSDIFAVVLTMLGISLFFFDQLTPGHLLGNCVAIVAGMAFAGYYMSLEGASESERMSAILMAHGLTFCVSIPFIALEPPELGAAPVICIFILGVVQLGIPYVLLGRASGSCPPLACSLLGAVEPLLNPVWVFIFDGEAPGMWALIGGVVVVVTITVWCVYGDLREKAEKA